MHLGDLTESWRSPGKLFLKKGTKPCTGFSGSGHFGCLLLVVLILNPTNYAVRQTIILFIIILVCNCVINKNLFHGMLNVLAEMKVK